MNKHEQNSFNQKRPTKCWTCEWAAGKEGKCMWACSLEPVPGWKAIPTEKSFIVCKCPLYEKAVVIKLGIVRNNSRFQYFATTKEQKQQILEEIKILKEQGLSYETIAQKLGYSVRQLYRFVKLIKESEKDGKI